MRQTMLYPKDKGHKKTDNDWQNATKKSIIEQHEHHKK